MTINGHSQRVTLLYIQVIQDEIATHPVDIGKFVEGLISKCPENEKEIIAAERWVRTGE